jgi:hypothetical protein
LPDCLLPSHCQGQIDTIEGHPVYFPFPAGPVPPHKAVACSTHILVVSEPVTKILLHVSGPEISTAGQQVTEINKSLSSAKGKQISTNFFINGPNYNYGLRGLIDLCIAGSVTMPDPHNMTSSLPTII